MNDITPEEAIEILSHYTDLGYGIVIEDEDVSKIVQALSLARKTLANGTPYNPSGDCISRSALREAIFYHDYSPCKIDENANEIMRQARIIIDNAPTVEAYTSEDIMKYVSATEDLVREKLERPKGEWVDREYRMYFPRDAEPDYNDDTYDEKTHSVMRTHIVCSNCGAERRFYHNFCGNCGADMRKG